MWIIYVQWKRSVNASWVRTEGDGSGGGGGGGGGRGGDGETTAPRYETAEHEKRHAIFPIDMIEHNNDGNSLFT